MLASLPESAPAPDPSADKSDIAQTVRQSVMAEQVSHNVVNVPESASGMSPLVDVVANHTSTSAAESGNNHTTPNPNHLKTRNSTQEELRLSQVLGMPRPSPIMYLRSQHLRMAVKRGNQTRKL
jgi:hypothetical protein